jgi:hypothetical protein
MQGYGHRLMARLVRCGCSNEKGVTSTEAALGGQNQPYRALTLGAPFAR